MHNSMKPSVSNASGSKLGQPNSSTKYSLIPSEMSKTDRNQNTVGSGATSHIGWMNPTGVPSQTLVSEATVTQSYKTDVSYGQSGMRSIYTSYNPSNYASTNMPASAAGNGNLGWNVSSNSSSTYPAPTTSYPPSTTTSYPYPPTSTPLNPPQPSRFQKTEFYTPSTLPVYPVSPSNNLKSNHPSSQSYSLTPTLPSSKTSNVTPTYPSSKFPSKGTPYNPSSQSYSLTPTNPSSQSYSLTPTNPSNKTSAIAPTYPSSKLSGIAPTYPSSKSSGIAPTYPSSKSSGIAPTYPSSKYSGIAPTYPSSKSSGVTPTYPSSKSSGITPSYPPSKTPSSYPSKPPTTSPGYPSKTPTYPRSIPSSFPSKKTSVNPPIRTATKKSSTSNLLSRLSSQSLLKLGEKGSGIRARGVVQDFHQLRAQLLSSGELFEDNEFPAVDSSIFFSKSPPKPFEWKRPMEISENPKLFVDGATRFDVQQGELGDCWLLAAVANLTLSKGLFAQIVPDDQGFGDQYAGIFHFRFWQYGRWVDVVIDDRLPTYYGKLVFLHSSETNEFWSALLEKAYAKLHGSYEALKGGSTCEAMEDFTGGVTEMYEMNAAPPNLYQIMLKAYERSSLMGCSIEPDPSVLEAQTRDGLVKGHAYSITRVKYIDINTPNSSGKIPLIRLRNPWGNETEWNGAWSDKSAEWRFIPQHEKEEIGLTFEHDGEFWMSYQDFKAKFSRLEICNLNPDSLIDEDETGDNKRKWEMSMYEGEWVRGVTAGGCRNFLETFWHNPQYNITLNDPDEDDDDSKCTVIVALMQKNRRSQRRMGMECLTVGFAMYHLPDPANLPKPLDLNFFKYNASVARSPSFINLREVSCRFKLPPGSYCIVPSTFEANEEGEFILRVFSENKNNMEENDEEVGLGEVDQRVINEPIPEEDKAEDKVKEFFRKIAGDDMEVDWMELKEILDYAMRSELPSASSSSQNGIVNMLLSLVCGAACKDTPLAQVFETKNEGFSKDVCRSMVAMMDVDRSGKLGFEEFKALWADIRNWKGVFKLYDKDGSKCLSAFELRQALNSAGYRLNNHILNILAHRYSTKDGMITFDDFMMCAVRLKAMIDIFRERDPDSTNTATFTMEEWVEKTLYS